MSKQILPREACLGTTSFSPDPHCPAHCAECEGVIRADDPDDSVGVNPAGELTCRACLPEAWAGTTEMQLAELAEYQRQALNLAGLAALLAAERWRQIEQLAREYPSDTLRAAADRAFERDNGGRVTDSPEGLAPSWAAPEQPFWRSTGNPTAGNEFAADLCGSSCGEE